MVVLALPKYAVLKNKYNSKYLSFRKADKYLSFSGNSVLSPEAKFAIEPASSGNGQVHVRCAYNNKYLVRNSSGFVIASATKPEEDATKDTCTLLEPFSVLGDTCKYGIRFRHVQSGNYACLNYSGDAANVHDACLHAVSQSPDYYLMDAYEVINWETLVIFPSHNIAFKGSNGYYLGGVNTGDLQLSVDDKNQENASFRVEPVGDGSVQVFSNYFSKYWSYNDRNDSSWIWADRTDKSPDDPKELFWPIKLESNDIALRSLANNRFIRGLVSSKPQCLNALEKTITKECHFTVEELVISTRIHNIVYRHDDARVYNETPIVCGKGVANNDSHGQDTMQIPIEYTEAKSTSWENSVSLTVGASTTFEAGVPFITKGQIKFNVSVTGGHKWGGTNNESFKRGLTYTATVPPKTHVEINYVATKGTCDIPFSYTLAHTYSDGTHELTVKDDGLYTGVNCYNYSFDKKETPLA